MPEPINWINYYTTVNYTTTANTAGYIFPQYVPPAWPEGDQPFRLGMSGFSKEYRVALNVDRRCYDITASCSLCGQETAASIRVAAGMGTENAAKQELADQHQNATGCIGLQNAKKILSKK